MQSFEDYLNAQPGLKASTIHAYVKDARCFERWENALPPLLRFGLPLALRVDDFLMERKIKPAAHNRYLRSLQHLEEYRDYAPEVGYGDARVQQLPRVPRPQPRKVAPLLPNEIDDLLGAIHAHGRPTEKWRNLSLVSFLYATDLTMHETCTLRIDQLQPSPDAPTQVTIERDGAAVRANVVPEQVSGPLKTWLQTRKGSGVKLEESPYVWPVLSTNRTKRAGDPISEQGVRAILTRYAHLAGIQQKVTPTLLRKSRHARKH